MLPGNCSLDDPFAIKWKNSPIRKYRDWLRVQEIERLEKEQTEEHKQWLKIPREERLREKRELGGELRLGLDGINPDNEDFYYEAEVIGRSISSLIMCPYVF